MAAIATTMYAAAGFGFVLLLNANTENTSVAVAIWLACSLVAGFAVGRLTLGRLPLPILPLVAVLFAIPFDYADQYVGSESPPVWFATAWIGAASLVALLLGLAARRIAVWLRAKRTRLTGAHPGDAS